MSTKQKKGAKKASEKGVKKTSGPFSQGLEMITRHPFITIVIVGIIICLPLIQGGLPETSDDAVWHVIYFDNFATQVLSGEIYPRWLYLTNGGLGGPTFFFYQPMSYYIALIFRPLPISTIHQLGLASSLGVILSGVTSFFWLREISSPRAALVGSMFYLLLPYPVAQDVYVRAAFGEAFTFVWMPLAMLAALRITKGSRKAVIGLAFSYGMLCMTHLPITVIFSPVLIFYILVFSERGTIFRTLSMTLAGMTLGAGMASAYIIPAVAYQYYVYLNEMKEGSYFFGNWLMTRDLAIFGSMRYFQLTAEAVIAVLFCSIVGSLDSDSRQRQILIFWSTVAMASVFMTLYISYPLWSAITILQSLQFPWRFNAISSLAIVALIAFSLSTLDWRRSVKNIALVMFLTVFGGYCVFDFVRVVNDSQTVPRPELRKNYDKKLYRLQEETHGRWPKAVAPSLTELDEGLKTIPSADGHPVKAFFDSRQGNVEILRWKPRSIEVNAENAGPDTLIVSQFSFPGWTARDLDSGATISTELAGDLGLVSVKLPAGKHRIAFTLEKLRPEIIGDSLSILCLPAGIILLFAFKRSSESADQDSPESAAEHA